ncbi:MAG TPA: hypothetical protein DEO26_02985, partial [Candidatus Veblenbacteria bacterium]|nr:hypothetical protein [Candidatus Veblenbacteria bacterium]
LSEARKYRLNLIIAHQYIEQLGDVVKAAVFGNIGTMVVFRIGADDAEFLEKEFAPIFTETDLVNLPNYHVYLKLMIDGVTSDPFSAVTMPPIGQRNNNRNSIIRVSRERYAQDRVKVEEKILRWAGVEEVFKETAQEESRSLNEEEATYKNVPARKFIQTRSNREPDEPPRLNLTQPPSDMFEDNCWVCGRKVLLPFKPDGIRPVYCKEDMKKIRQGLIAKPKPRLVVTNAVPAVPSSLPTVEEVKSAEPPAAVVESDNITVPPLGSENKPLTVPEMHLIDVLSAEPVSFKKNESPKTELNNKLHSIKPNQVVRFSNE